MFEPMELTNDAVIKVIGVGGGGGNAVEHMVRERIEGVEFFAVNTDAQALRKTAVGQTIQIGGGICCCIRALSALTEDNSLRLSCMRAFSAFNAVISSCITYMELIGPPL